jgi:hypothetical protein
MTDSTFEWKQPSRDNPTFANMSDEQFEAACRTRPASNEEIIACSQALEREPSFVKDVEGLEYYMDPRSGDLQPYRDFLTAYRDQHLYDRNALHIVLAYPLFRQKMAALISDYDDPACAEFLQRRKIQQRAGGMIPRKKINSQEIIFICKSIIHNEHLINTRLKNSTPDSMHTLFPENEYLGDDRRQEFRFGLVGCGPALNICIRVLSGYYNSNFTDWTVDNVKAEYMKFGRGLGARWLED